VDIAGMSRRKLPGRSIVASPPASSEGAGPATDPLTQLIEHQALLAVALEQERQLILSCRRRGYSWRLIGAAAGVTAQAAEQRAARAKRRAGAP
jgi:DNA-directed RNA polymerase specialized sigma24 family protein